MNAEETVVSLIKLHGGELVGRTRLQKEAYLLHRCGANLSLAFTYHHYGPYSFDLADGLIDADVEDRIEIEERIGSYGIRYAIFRSTESDEVGSGLGDLSSDRARSFIEKMQGVSDIVLELAATVVYLREEGGYGQESMEETKERKPLKATKERMDQALSLLSDLGLG